MIRKHRTLFVLFALLSFTAMSEQECWTLEFRDDFDGTNLDMSVWGRLWPGKSDWNRNLSPDPTLGIVTNGTLVLKGVRNADKTTETRECLCGGVCTHGTISMLYGKVSVRARFEDQKGAWPAIWMLPVKDEAGWPADGEIDIVERLNNDDFVYQTVHSDWPSDEQSKGGKGTIKPSDWNIYTLEWTPEQLVWKVNDRCTHVYRRQGNATRQFPWTKPFYLILDMQLGGDWVGGVDLSTLPVAMHVDWVEFYSLLRNGKKTGDVLVEKRH